MKTVVADVSLLEELLSIENDSFSVPWSRKSFEEAFSSDNISIFALLTENSDVAGFACLLIIDYEAELLNIAVKSDFRGMGYGKVLMQRIMLECERKDIDSLYLEVRESNVSARSLYLKSGLTEIGIRKRYYVSPTEDAVIMQKNFQNDKD